MKRIIVALALMVCAVGLMAGDATKPKAKKCPDCDPKVATKECKKCECCTKATTAGKDCQKCHPKKKEKK